MSSTNKTANLGLNSWIGPDKPMREDFNNDNNILDKIISNHINNSSVHTSADEKAVWNKHYHIITYLGNSSSSRTIGLGDVPFVPSWGFIFAANHPLSVIDIANEANYNYFGIFSSKGSSSGITYTSNQLKVIQSSSAVKKTEYRNMNENGITYICVLFR